MKRLFAMLLALIMVLPLVGCGAEKVSIDEEKMYSLFSVIEDEFTGIKVFYRDKDTTASIIGMFSAEYGLGNEKRLVPYSAGGHSVYTEDGFFVDANITYEESASIKYTYNLVLLDVYVERERVYPPSDVWKTGEYREIQIILDNQKYTVTSIKNANDPSVIGNPCVNFVALGISGGEFLKQICAQKSKIKIRIVDNSGEVRIRDVDPAIFKKALAIWNDYISIGGATQDLTKFDKNVKKESIGQ